MTPKTLRQVAWLTDAYVKGPIRGVAVGFGGLGAGPMRDSPSEGEMDLGSHGILTVVPYYSPWGWMNRAERQFVAEVIDATYSVLGLDRTIPLLSVGGSMGGLSALLFARYYSGKLAGCYANCPVCDLAFHCDERPDVARTVYCAFRGYAEDFGALLKEHSPVDQVPGLPKIPYLIIHGEADKAVSKTAHSDRLVPSMQARGLNVDYIGIPGMGHCGPIPTDVRARIMDFHLTTLGLKAAQRRQS